jgi:hypothetical protein
MGSSLSTLTVEPIGVPWRLLSAHPSLLSHTVAGVAVKRRVNGSLACADVNTKWFKQRATAAAPVLSFLAQSQQRVCSYYSREMAELGAELVILLFLQSPIMKTMCSLVFVHVTVIY